ncbi:hypothetical protein ABEB36_002777 [Hypothenemus hampei]|uniref:Uncharacterized protein n=1 Tax=Hypothenemus hampei TaxID=57062 RepID=A0ABD1F6X5_HYPHA
MGRLEGKCVKRFSNDELTDIVVCWVNENARQAPALSKELYQNYRVPNKCTFPSFVQRLRDMDSFPWQTYDKGRIA